MVKEVNYFSLRRTKYNNSSFFGYSIQNSIEKWGSSNFKVAVTLIHLQNLRMGYVSSLKVSKHYTSNIKKALNITLKHINKMFAAQIINNTHINNKIK